MKTKIIFLFLIINCQLSIVNCFAQIQGATQVCQGQAAAFHNDYAKGWANVKRCFKVTGNATVSAAPFDSLGNFSIQFGATGDATIFFTVKDALDSTKIYSSDTLIVHIGTCVVPFCTQNLSLIYSTPYNTALYSAEDTLTAGGQFTAPSGSDLHLTAGTRIELNPGFIADEGSHFVAEIAPCTPVIASVATQPPSQTISGFLFLYDSITGFSPFAWETVSIMDTALYDILAITSVVTGSDGSFSFNKNELQAFLNDSVSYTNETYYATRSFDVPDLKPVKEWLKSSPVQLFLIPIDSCATQNNPVARFSQSQYNGGSNQLTIDNGQLTIVKIFPNPATNSLNILTNDDGEYRLSIYNCQLSILNSQLFHKLLQLDVSNFAKGMYLIEILNTATGERYIQKEVIR